MPETDLFVFTLHQIYLVTLSKTLSPPHLQRSVLVINQTWARYTITETFTRRCGQGRPRITSERTDREIVRSAIRNPAITGTQFANELKGHVWNNAISAQTVRHRLHKADSRSMVIRPTQNEKRRCCGTLEEVDSDNITDVQVGNGKELDDPGQISITEFTAALKKTELDRAARHDAAAPKLPYMGEAVVSDQHLIPQRNVPRLANIKHVGIAKVM
ncbi:hypothetical protein ILUMI_03995 [Ignelater luminosus]|uniref:Transposase Tc1-like domain-containing protein n=1 Tax=Ignelater luminosus TaxID=2038154 RepID=A0A8K0DDF7_IGNLU|nr:hypothetical protein ILUMI_03995 [Ignelater luminosus]